MVKRVLLILLGVTAAVRRVEVGGPIRFTSAVLPAYLRRTRNIEELLPWLYLKGVSTGQFEEALAALGDPALLDGVLFMPFLLLPLGVRSLPSVPRPGMP